MAGNESVVKMLLDHAHNTGVNTSLLEANQLMATAVGHNQPQVVWMPLDASLDASLTDRRCHPYGMDCAGGGIVA